MIQLPREAGMLFNLVVSDRNDAQPEAQLIIAARPAGTTDELRVALHAFVDEAVDDLVAFRRARVAQA